MTLNRRTLLSTLILSAAFVSTSLPAAEPDGTSATKPAPRDANWMKRHDGFVAQAKQGGVDLLFLGDSITDGWRGRGKAVWEKYWAPLKAANFGIGGDRTQHVLWRLDHGNLDGLKPKVAVVLIGVNNIPDDNNSPRQVLEGVTAVVNKLREKLPETKVLLLGIFPFREDFCDQRAKALQVNQALHKLDDGQWIRFLDIGYRFIQPDGRISKDMMRDFLHLSPTGYRLWAEAIEPELAVMLGEKPIVP